MTTSETNVGLFVLCNSNFIKSGVCLSQQAGSACDGTAVFDGDDGNDGMNDGDDGDGSDDDDEEDENEDQIIDIWQIRCYFLGGWSTVMRRTQEPG